MGTREALLLQRIALDTAPAASSPFAAMRPRLLVLYGSQTGAAKGIAEVRRRAGPRSSPCSHAAR